MASAVGNIVSCKCMNVCFVEGNLTEPTSLQLSQIDEQVLMQLNDGKGVKMLIDDFTVIGRGAQISVSSLINSKVFKGWKVFTCFNCKSLTHAVKNRSSDNDNVTLVNCPVLIGSQEQTALRSTPKYFPVYGVLLETTVAKSDVRTSSLKPSVVNNMRQMQDDTSEYLKSEEQLMIERVEAFKASELAKFDLLKQTCIQQEKHLEKLVFAAYCDANDDADSAFERSVEEIADLSIKKRGDQDNNRCDSAVDDPFELDPFSDGEIDGDGSDLDDDNDELPNYLTRTGVRGDHSEPVAKSMPIQVPRDLRRSIAASFSDDEETPDPHNMQASIKALAQSIGGDGTEMFGDLPRHRYNSQRHHF